MYLPLLPLFLIPSASELHKITEEEWSDDHDGLRRPILTAPRFEAFEFDGRFFVNPGSATGAWSGVYG